VEKGIQWCGAKTICFEVILLQSFGKMIKEKGV